MRSILLLVLFAANLSSFGQNFRYPPRNEVRKDSSLKVFVDTLKAVINRKDAPALLKMISPTITIYFDSEDNNIKGFIKEYKPADTLSMVWIILQKITSMGGVFANDEGKVGKNAFVFPYVEQMNVKHEYCDGCFTCIATLAPDINLREKPDRLSAAVGKLNYHVVKVIEEPSSKQMGGNSENWVYVQTFDKSITGWVRRDLTWDPCGYRLWLHKKNGKWLIDTFIAGD